MLQEKSCKNLANAIHRAFARVVFNEYKDKLLGVEMNQTQNDPELENADYYGDQQYQDEERQNMTGDGSLGTPHRSAKQSQIMRDASPTYSTIGKTGHGATVGYRDTSMVNQSIAMGARQDNNKTNIFGKSPQKRMDRTPTNFDRDPDASGFDGAMGGVEKKITTTSHQQHSKIHSDTANALQNRSKSNINIQREQTIKINDNYLEKMLSVLPQQPEIVEK